MGRDPRADWLKAAAIFGVVFIHTPGDCWGLASIFRFCVPAFLGLWAVYFEAALAKRPPTERRSYLRSRFVRLAVPYFFWTTLYLLLFHRSLAQWRATSIHTIVGGWLGGYGWAGQYFFIILFQLMVIVPLFRHLVVGPRAMWGILGLGLIGYLIAELWAWRIPVVSGIGDRFFIYWLPYVTLGIGLARGYVRPLPALAVAIGSAGAIAFAPAEFRWFMGRWPKPSPYVLASVYVGSLGLIAAASGGAARSAEGSRPGAFGLLDDVVGYIGRNTFPIFLANPLIITALPKGVVGSLRDGLVGEFQHTGLTIFVMAACLVLGWAFRRVGLGILVGA